MHLHTLISFVPLLDTNYTAYATSKSIHNTCALMLNQWLAACNIRILNWAIFRMISHSFKSTTAALPCDVHHTSSSAVHLQMKQHGALTPMREGRRRVC